MSGRGGFLDQLSSCLGKLQGLVVQLLADLVQRSLQLGVPVLQFLKSPRQGIAVRLLSLAGPRKADDLAQPFGGEIRFTEFLTQQAGKRNIPLISDDVALDHRDRCHGGRRFWHGSGGSGLSRFAIDHEQVELVEPGGDVLDEIELPIGRGDREVGPMPGESRQKG